MSNNKLIEKVVNQLINDLSKPFVLITMDDLLSNKAECYSFSLTHDELITLLEDATYLLTSDKTVNDPNQN